ncbi:RNA polymerase sigma factor [Candidatus Acetothermia bacterium]|nr:RNA polymerase sigma factor [Candidatus Acetothermia bacterium]
MDEEKRISGAVVPQDEEAFAELFREYYPRIFRYCRANGLSEADAQEVVQVTMIAVWTGRGNFQRRTALSTWIFGIAHHKMVDLWRQHGRDAAVTTAAKRLLPNRAEKDFSEQLTITDRMMRALAELSEKHRQVILLAFYHGLSCREMSAILGCSMGTIKSRLYHAKEQLKELISNG